jgi:iron complex outermembrane recepter protein
LNQISKTILFASCAVGAFSTPARAQDDEAQNAPVAAAAVSDEIIVTARRTDERLQDVPVAVAAFDNRALERSTVQELSEVKSIASGLNFNSEGGKSTTNVSLRGIGQLPVGLTTPGVVTYFNNIAIPSLGSSIPTYDIANIQVLKGPQGTLFGKSTLGGAILVNTVQPDLYDIEGYLRGTYGRFEYRAIEGAINVPIVPGKIALRLAGQIRRQDERIRSLDADFFATPEVQALGVSDPNAGDYPGFDDVNNDSVRASLTIAPSDRFSNTTVAEYFRADERAAGLYLFKADLAALQNTALFPLMGDPTRAAIAVQLAALAKDYAQENPRGAFDGGINGGQAYRKSVAIVNTTSFELTDSLSLRNIFGYRKNTNEQSINTSALPILDQGGIPNPFFGGLVTQPFITYFAEQRYVRDYIDNDFQILYDGASGLNGILGAYYSVDGPAGPSGDQFTTFSSLGRIPPTTTHVKNRSFAIYSQVTIPLTDRLNLNLGGRYSWDKAEFCYNPGNAATFESVSFDECKQNVADRVGTATEFSDGFGQASVKDSYPTWTVGFDYKATPDLLLYVTSRRGVRPKNLNFPLFESDPVTCPSGNYSISCVDLTSYQTIKQERVTDIEIGEKLTFNLSGARGRINLAGFYSKYENATQFLSNSGNFMFPRGTLDAPPSSFIINAADLSIYGLEIDASVSPDDNLTIGFNGAITKTKIDKLLPVNTGGELGPNVGSFGREQINKLTPSFSGTFSASWISPVHPADADLIFSGDLYMTDDFGGQQGFQLEGYSLVNGRVDLKGIANSGLDLGFYVKNLFDVEYQAGVSVILPAAPYNSLYLGPPRTWGVEAKYSF